MGLGKVIHALGKTVSEKAEEIPAPVEEINDATAWLVNSSFGEFLLLSTKEIKYMCLLAYAFMAGNSLLKIFTIRQASSIDYL